MEYIKIRFGKNLGQMHSRLQKTIDEMFQQVNPRSRLGTPRWMSMKRPKRLLLWEKFLG